MLLASPYPVSAPSWTLFGQRLAVFALVFAWVCVNSPQTAIVGVVEWISAANHFSHNARLANDVVEILSGVKHVQKISAARRVDQKSEPKSAIESANSNKIEIVSESTDDSPRPSRVDFTWARIADLVPECERGEPEHQPPRCCS